jgi:hypothetical protein
MPAATWSALALRRLRWQSPSARLAVAAAPLHGLPDHGRAEGKVAREQLVAAADHNACCCSQHSATLPLHSAEQHSTAQQQSTSIRWNRPCCIRLELGHHNEKKRERIRPWAWIEETDWVLSNGGTRISYHAAVPFPSVWQWVDAHATHQVPFCRLSSENWRFPGSNP